MASISVIIATALFIIITLLSIGAPLPVGYKRGKVMWVKWSWRRMRPFVIYYVGGKCYVGTHPDDAEEVEGSRTSVDS